MKNNVLPNFDTINQKKEKIHQIRIKMERTVRKVRKVRIQPTGGKIVKKKRMTQIRIKMIRILPIKTKKIKIPTKTRKVKIVKITLPDKQKRGKDDKIFLIRTRREKIVR